jgi:hypothetical protein
MTLSCPHPVIFSIQANIAERVEAQALLIVLCPACIPSSTAIAVESAEVIDCIT